MNCDAFLQWMKTRTGQGMPENPEVRDHLRSCPACRRIFSLDACLEAGIQQAFTPHNLPAGLAETIDACVDRFHQAPPPMDLPRHARESSVKTDDPVPQKGDTENTGPANQSV